MQEETGNIKEQKMLVSTHHWACKWCLSQLRVNIN